jgi:sulfatase maturation enzyme AslB (radical SAM superfamily)
MEQLKIVLPRISGEEDLYAEVISAFAARVSMDKVSVAPQADQYPDYYYYMDMADACLSSADAMQSYLRCYREVCHELTGKHPDRKELFEYLVNSFWIYSIREIHSRQQETNFAAILTELEQEIDRNRINFDKNPYASRFEKRWCNRYVNMGADFNLSFLLPVTLRCNKRCKYCMTFSPYLDIVKHNYHPTFEELCRNIDKLFEIVDNSYGIQFAGGEPCIRQDLPDLIDYVNDNYKHRIREFTRQGTGFGIITNSSIEFSDRLIAASKRFGPKLCWLLDDYHFSVADKIAEKLKSNGINYMRRDQKTAGIMHCDGWVNLLNDFSKPTNATVAAAAVQCCGQKQLIFQFIVANGRMYPCSRVMASDFYWPDMEASRQYSVEMFDENITKEEKVTKIKSLLCANYFHTCDKCKGLYEGRKRLYPAVQLTSEEYQALKDGRISMSDFGNYDE